MTQRSALTEPCAGLNDDDELGLAYLITTDRILATIGGILGGATITAALLIRYSRHLNQTSKEHRP